MWLISHTLLALNSIIRAQESLAQGDVRRDENSQPNSIVIASSRRIPSDVGEKPSGTPLPHNPTVPGMIEARSSEAYRPDIDGLRAVAILAVLGFHAFPRWIPGGFVGVDIFFVVSGYLITGIIVQGLRANTFTLPGFFARRIRRLFPALLLVAAACLIAGWFVLLPDEYAQAGKHIFAGATFVSNFALWREGGYFDPGVEVKPLQHLWSLGVEEQFYLLWPLLVTSVWRRGGGLFRWVLLIAASSFGACLATLQVDPSAAFYFPFGRLWELLAGALLACTAGRSTGAAPPFRQRWFDLALDARLAGARCAGGALLVGWSIFRLTFGSVFPGWLALGPVVGTVLVISAGPEAWLNRRILSNPLVVWVGIVSYPLYLWHWPLLSFAQILFGRTPPDTVRLALVIASLILAGLTFVAVERPIRASSRRSIIVILCGGALLEAGIGLGIYLTGGLAGRMGDRAELAADTEHDPWGNDRTRQLACPKELGGLDSALDFCRVSSNARPALALWGDSHAQHLFPGLSRADPRTWLLIARIFCPPTSGVEVVVKSAGCSAHNQIALDHITALKSVQTVVLSFLSTYPAGNFGVPGRLGERIVPASISSPQFNSASKEELFYLGLDKTVSVIERSGKSVIVFVDIPSLPGQPRDCVRAYLTPLADRQPCSSSREEAIGKQKVYRGLLRRLVAAHPGVRLFDSFEVICDAPNCAYRNNEMLFYRDSNHLSLRGSEWMAQRFLKWMAQDGPQATLGPN